MDDGELGADWLPGKSMNRFFDLYAVNWNLLLAHMEYFHVVIDPAVFDVRFVFAKFDVAIDFDAQVVTRLLPVHLTVGNAEQVLNTRFIAARNFQEGHSGRCVLLFSHPVGNCVVGWTPSKVSDTRHLNIKNNILLTSTQQ